MRRLSLFLSVLFFVASVCVAEDFVPSSTSSSSPFPPPTSTPAASLRTLQIDRIDSSAFPRVVLSTDVFEGSQRKTGLQLVDFLVTENDTPLAVTFAPPLPRSFVIVMDTSGSMIQNLSLVKTELKKFIGLLGRDDSAALVGFSRTATVLSPLQTDKAALRSAVDALVANGESALYDALFTASDALKTALGGRTIVLITDSLDDDGYGKAVSSRSAADALAQAKSSGARIAAIAIGEKPDRQLLGKWAADTGGSLEQLTDVAMFEKALRAVLDLSAGGYLLGFTSPLPQNGQTALVRVKSAEAAAEKSYQLPKAPGVRGSSKPLKPTDRSAVVPSTSSTASVPRTSNLESAAALQTSVWIPLPFESLTRFYSLAAMNGQLIRVTLASGQQSCAVRVFTPTSVVGEARSSPDYTAPLEFLASTEKIYLSSRGGTGCNLMITTANYFDAGTMRDAGVSESSALQLKPLEDASGYLWRRGDTADLFKLTGITRGEWTIVARPSPNCSLNMQLLNDLGEQIKGAFSRNVGAGVSIRFDALGTKPLFLRLDIQGDDGKLCGYALRYGPGDVDAPLQPEVH